MNAQQLRSILDYDPLTGVFTWKYKRGPRRPAAGAVAAKPSKTWYARITIDQSTYLAHRMAWLYVHGEWPGGTVDHINGDKQDNRIENLRCVSAQKNVQNMRKPTVRNTSGFLGVSRNKKRWMAKIQVSGKSLYLGTFDTKERAYEEYVAAKRMWHVGCTL